MSDFLFARSQMGMSLAFHIVFAVLGIGLPVLMAIAEAAYLRTKRPVYLELSKRRARGTAILFAVGAVSGTVLAFELGLLWSGFMQHAAGRSRVRSLCRAAGHAASRSARRSACCRRSIFSSVFSRGVNEAIR